MAYQDLISGDEIISDVYDIKDVGDGLYEIDGKMVKPGSENFGTHDIRRASFKKLTIQ